MTDLYPKSYDPIRHLAMALTLSEHWDRVLVVALSVYLDRSADDDRTTVAGYVSEAGAWVSFQADWERVLAEFGVSGFHMKHFAHSVREFAPWKYDEPRRRAFLEALIEVVQRHTFHGFGAAVQQRDFDRLMKAPMAQEWFGAHPYSFCVRAVGRDVRLWKEQAFPRASVEFVLEDGDPGKGDAMRIMERDRFAPPIFRAKATQTPDCRAIIRPFEAADLLAWELRKAHLMVEQGREWDDLRRSLKALSVYPTSTWSDHTADMIESTMRLQLNDPDFHLPI